jgi:hypothetical protein
MAIGSKEVTLRSRLSRVLTVLVVAICVATEIGAIVYGDIEVALRALAPLALLGYGVYTVFWAPFVRVGPANVEFRNPLRTVVVTWPAIENIETRWGLTLVTAERRFTAWASPAQSRYSAASRIRRDSFGRADFAAENARTKRGNDPASVAGLAPMLVTRQWEQYRDAGLLHAVEGDGFEQRWHVGTIAVLAVLLVASVVSASLG